MSQYRFIFGAEEKHQVTSSDLCTTLTLSRKIYVNLYSLLVTMEAAAVFAGCLDAI